MSELIKVFQENTFTSILGIVVAIFLGSKWVYEAYEWFRDLFEKWRKKLNGEEYEKRTTDERLSKLESSNEDQGKDIQELKVLIKKIEESVLKIEGQNIRAGLERKRNAILDFADVALDMSKSPSREKYNDIFRKYEEYEKLIEDNGLTNGQTEITIEMIRESFKQRVMEHNFMEDIRK